MSAHEVILPPPQPRHAAQQGAPRDLSSRLYREIGLAAVEAALCEPERRAGALAARKERAPGAFRRASFA
jgi:hypothetical protein